MARRERLEDRVAARVRSLREGAGLSQAQLAEKADTSRSQVANVERGGRAATLSTLEAFARALGVRVTDLLQEEPIANPPDRAHRIAGMLRVGPAVYRRRFRRAS